MRVILALLFLGQLLLSTTAECTNTTVSATTQGECVTNIFQIPPGCSGMCVCTDKCIWMNLPNGYQYQCINKTISEPTIYTAYPSSCMSYIDSDLTTNVNCNYFGNGTVCPMYCNNVHNECVPTKNNKICKPYIGWICPLGCSYAQSTNSCIPSDINSVCGSIASTSICPYGCTYDYHLSKCISTDINYACELTRRLKCPDNCKLNPRGDTCISNQGNYICQRQTSPVFPSSCTWNTQKNICVKINDYTQFTNIICEPVHQLTCPYNVFTIQTNMLPQCTQDSTDLCSLGYASGLQYPVRLKNKYSNIKCAYSNGCEGKFIQQICCSR